MNIKEQFLMLIAGIGLIVFSIVSIVKSAQYIIFMLNWDAHSQIDRVLAGTPNYWPAGIILGILAIILMVGGIYILSEIKSKPKPNIRPELWQRY